MSHLRPRLCLMEKGVAGYGFHLHGDKGKSGQFIRLVEPDTPASAAGLLAGDRLMFVNGENVEGESHQQVVSRIRATSGALELIVVDDETAELLKKHNLQCRREFVTEGIPVPGRDSDSDRGDAQSNGTPREASPLPHENGDASSERSGRLSITSSNKDEPDGLRPRLCHMKKGQSGYGFNLHSEKSRPGQFIRAVDDHSPAQRAGLRPLDKIIQVNGVPVAGMQHSEVVAAIKAGGDETRLLVVDAETEEFFKKCNVTPTEEHVTGALPEAESKRESEEEAAAELKPEESVSSRASSVSSSSSLQQAAPSSPPAEVEESPRAEPAPAADGLGLGVSLAEAKERAHKKRAAKKAPAMDWSKRNELFSNL
uniref:Na(+)/H(+) exchange regulatory cofactor NHE-RF n=1 Tax=Oryzias latipes TaxID=8090 RepID=A0A3P9JCV5_ORYLA